MTTAPHREPSPPWGRAEQGKYDHLARDLARQWVSTSVDTAAGQVERLAAVSLDLAAREPTSVAVAELLRCAARFYARGGHYRPAYAMGVHELAVWRARSDVESALSTTTFTGYLTALGSLARIDRALGRLHEVADALDEFLELQVRHRLAEDVHRAWTLRELGAVMLAGGRAGHAVDAYLQPADAVYRRLGDTTLTTVHRAACQALLGQAHRALDQPVTAHSHFTRARSLLNGAVPRDDAARRLVDATTTACSGTGPDVPVPAEFGLPAWPAPQWD
ncbi:hypothetical protein [Saccharothrix sp. Mg75]|uniref:hypothetical protein n=1 Tax=Saccharothrix sp. Mg75 TaxID=3445357 RepID=UPI003EEA65B0